MHTLPPGKVAPASILGEDGLPYPGVRRVLDLFSGTKTVARAYRARGYHVLTVDNDPKWTPDILVDILTWDYEALFKPGTFFVVACGVPCTEFSSALTTRPRNLALGDSLALKALEIIKYLQPPVGGLKIHATDYYLTAPI